MLYFIWQWIQLLYQPVSPLQSCSQRLIYDSNSVTLKMQMEIYNAEGSSPYHKLAIAKPYIDLPFIYTL